jgi:N-acetylneuraminate synthase
VNNASTAARTAPELAVGARLIGDDHPCYVIAEACINHNGDFATAVEMVERAAAAGADAIKFQVHDLEHEMLREVPTSANFGKPLWEVLEETNLTDAQHIELRDLCAERGIQYLCTAYCREAGDFLASIGVPLLKTGSGETTNLPFLRALAGHKTPLLVSTGMATLEEVDLTVEALRATRTPFGITHCTSEYPPVYEDINLGLIPYYKERYGIVVGHSDHSPSIYTALAAVAWGASVIEKHFTLDRSQPGADHAVSLEPHELAELVEGIRIVEAAGGARKEVFEREEPIRAWAHHSVVTLRPIAAGETFSEENVWVKRPGTGIPAAELDGILGRTAARDVTPDSLLAWDDVA